MKELIGKLIKSVAPLFYKKIIDKKGGRYSYTFSREKYPDSFLNNNYPIESFSEKVPEVIYTFWTGNNEMSENRKRGLKSLKTVSGIKVILITPNNLQNYILKDSPLHPAYELLSLVHKSDYLRCYFMHHHGGGYADIKNHHYSWKKAFKKLKNNPGKFAVGYPEIGGIATVGGQLYKDLKFHMPLLIGNCAFICRSNTKLTNEWYIELHHRIDEYVERLELYADGKISEYPIPYTYLMGNIFHPLSLKYHKNLIQDKNLMPEFKNYR